MSKPAHRCRRGHGVFLAAFATPLGAEQVSEGQPHKWEAVPNKSMYDFVTEGFELKSVAYGTSVLGPQTDAPDVHYFLQKGSTWLSVTFTSTTKHLIIGAINLAKLTASNRCFEFVAGCPVCGHLLSG